jgi:hypothetical protein
LVATVRAAPVAGATGGVCFGDEAATGAAAFVAVEAVCSTVACTVCVTGAVAFETAAGPDWTVCSTGAAAAAAADAVLPTSLVTCVAVLSTGAGAAGALATAEVAAFAACTVLETVEVSGATVVGASVLRAEGRGNASARDVST